jgi:dipeptidyl aminopeptidase/acylaminoacyl peptidase
MRHAGPIVALLLVSAVAAQEGYRLPPDVVRRCVESPPMPRLAMSPSGKHAVLLYSEAMPSIAVQSQPILRLAGRRIDPRTFGPPAWKGRTTSFAVLTIADGKVERIHLPGKPSLGGLVWTASGDRFAFTNTRADFIELWVADVATASAKKVPGVTLNATMWGVQWMPDQKHLLCPLRAASKELAESDLPLGPNIQQSKGRKAPVRTYQDLLTSPHEEALFDYYMTSQPAIVDPDAGVVRKVGAPAVYVGLRPSPDGAYLLVTRLQRPYSYLHTASSFPQVIEVTDLKGKRMHLVAELPLADGIPIGGVRPGPRSVHWIVTAKSTLAWIEALDGGDPRAKVSHRDRVMARGMSDGNLIEWFKTPDRLGGRGARGGVAYGSSGKLALVSTYDRRKRWVTTYRADPANPGSGIHRLSGRSAQDAYGDPGRPVTTVDAAGGRVLLQHEGAIYLRGSGASPKGDRPFLDRWDVATGEKQRLFHCGEGRYEQVITLLADDATSYVVRSESRTAPPNYFVVENGKTRPLTEFKDRMRELTRGITKRLVHYARADGIPLSATLYLPPNAKDGERLPLLVWAYPREYRSKKDAGQVRGSPHRYVRLSGTSPLLLTLAGYAVMNNAAMPVVGPTRTANDTFVPQLVAGAKAAIDKAVELGVGDRDRTAIAGHSYGAFMTANLLAHSDLFRAGVARSGAYNRTLTPFGFQNERRTFWEAPEVYFAMSPFMHAQKIDEPILLIHGEADNNSGTFPVQSKRLFHAIKGNGGLCRLVMLPHESHAYRARESVLHTLAETIDWLDRHVKNAKPRARK